MRNLNAVNIIVYYLKGIHIMKEKVMENIGKKTSVIQSVLFTIIAQENNYCLKTVGIHH